MCFFVCVWVFGFDDVTVCGMASCPSQMKYSFVNVDVEM